MLLLCFRALSICQNSQASPAILIINVMHKAKDMVFQQNLLEKVCFIAKMSGLAMVFPASFDVWKAPSVKDAHHPPP